jgi:hypothetical protein
MFEAMDLSADTGLSLFIYPPEPGSPSADALRLLASWAATQALAAESQAERENEAERAPAAKTLAAKSLAPPQDSATAAAGDGV